MSSDDRSDRPIPFRVWRAIRSGRDACPSGSIVDRQGHSIKSGPVMVGTFGIRGLGAVWPRGEYREREFFTTDFLLPRLF
jgi:hypothetical protein